jgi:uncharacterized protein (TIGR02271 family)
MSNEINTPSQNEIARSDSPRTGFPFLDLMFSMQKVSQQALSTYIPRSNGYYTGKPAEQSRNAVEVIPLGEETLNVEARTVQGNTVRLRRVVVETPMEKQVILHEEKVIVERRKPTGASATLDTLTEKAVEMTDTFEVVDAWKSVRLLEEVVLRKEVTERTETVRDTVRRDEIKIERPNVKAFGRQDSKA